MLFAEAEPLEHPLDGGVAQDLARGALRDAAPLGYGGRWAAVYIFFEQLLGGFIHLLGGLPPPILGSRDSSSEASLMTLM